MGVSLEIEETACPSKVAPEMKWRAWMAAVPLSERAKVHDLIKKWNKKKAVCGYLIGYEVASDGAHAKTNGEHMHFVVECNGNAYHNISERLKTWYQLRMKAGEGEARQFGAITEIKKLEKLKAYTLKDGTFDSNLDVEEVEKLISMSFKKTTTHTLWERIVNHLHTVPFEPDMESVHWRYTSYINDLRKAIIEYHIKEKTMKGLTKSSVESAARKYIMYHSPIQYADKVDLINWEFFSHHLI